MHLSHLRTLQEPAERHPRFERLAYSPHPVPDRTAPARGLVIGLTISVAAFWIPFTMIVSHLVR